MLLKKMKDPFLIGSFLFLIAALVTGALLYQNLMQSFQSDSALSNIHLTEDDKNFHYLEPLNATVYQQGIFEELEEGKEAFIANPSAANQEVLAELVVKNFIADFFTWSNKDGRADVGGLQFVASDIRQNFRQSAIDNFYLYLNQYIEEFGHDRLIEVSQVQIRSVELDAQWPVYETNEEGFEELVDSLPVVRVEAMWSYRGGFSGFLDEAVFYLTNEEGYLSIRAMMEIEVLEEMADA